MLLPAWAARLTLVIGLCACAIGVTSGIVIGSRNGVDVACPNDMGGSCTDYPNAADGWAVIAISIMLGAILVLVAAGRRVQAPVREPVAGE